MCLLALFFRVFPDAPLLVGANREEAYARPGEPPQILPGVIDAVGGRDPQAGGTWLGVNAQGVFAAVTNRLKSESPALPRSRGLLVRDLLGCASAAEAVTLATRELDSGQYAGCNVVCGDAERLVVLQGGDWLRVRPLPIGLHMLTNHDVNDASDQRLGHALWWLAQQPLTTSVEAIDAFKQLCGQRGGPDPPMCLVGPDRGTVSSSIVAIRQPLERCTYLHAQGPPDRTPFEDYSHLIDRLAATR